MSYPIPTTAFNHHIAVLGKTGSGKTTAIKGGVERALDAGARVCIVDPTAAWWGMKSSATGKSAAYPFVIFGGLHADFQIAANTGEAIAEIVGTSNTPAIIDTSQMRVRERTQFFADFADAIMRKNRGPLNLVIDEAHVFMPQGKVPDPQSGVMLAAGCNLVSGGRSRGLRVTLITQRPAKLHKDALTQVETLVAMRLIAPQDRAAVQEWIKDNADPAKGREIIESLATLKTGQGWVWAPELGLLERVTFPRIRTFDSSAAPTQEDGAAGPVLAAIDRDVISERLKTHAAEVLANDPAELRKRIRHLEQQATQQAPVIDTAAMARVEAEVFDRGANHGYRCGWDEHAQAMQAALSSIPAAPPALGDTKLPGPQIPFDERSSAGCRKPPIRVSAPGKPRDKSNGHAVHLPPGERATLTALIQFPEGLRREQLTVLTGYKRSSRDAYIQRLRERGFLETAGDRVTATDAGMGVLPDAEPLPTGRALQQHWLQRLPKGEREVLQILIAAYPRTVFRTSIDEKTGFQRSSRDAYLQRMRAKQLITEPSRGEVRASEDLF